MSQESAPRYTFAPVEEPYDAYERVLLQRVEEIKREYDAALKPYIDALVRSRACKPTRGYIRVELLSGEKGS